MKAPHTTCAMILPAPVWAQGPAPREHGAKTIPSPRPPRTAIGSAAGGGVENVRTMLIKGAVGVHLGDQVR